MKNKVFLLIAALLLPMKAQAAESNNFYGDPVPMYTTAYTADEGSITADGTEVRWNMQSCAAARKYLGYTALIYTDDLEFLGFYEVNDTGFGGDADGDGIGSIENGTCIDVFCNTKSDARIWMERTGGKVKVQFVKGVG